MRIPQHLKVTKVMSVVTVSGIALACSSTAFAEGLGRYMDPHVYVGGHYGLFKSGGSDEFDDEASMWDAVAGFKFNEYIGVEGSYANFGRYGNDFASAEVDGYGLALLGAFPIMDRVNIYGKAGRFYSNVDVEFGEDESTYEDSQFFYGVGTEIAVADPLLLSVEYDRYKVGMDAEDVDSPEDFEASDTDVDTVKVGAKYRF